MVRPPLGGALAALDLLPDDTIDDGFAFFDQVADRTLKQPAAAEEEEDMMCWRSISKRVLVLLRPEEEGQK